MFNYAKIIYFFVMLQAVNTFLLGIPVSVCAMYTSQQFKNFWSVFEQARNPLTFSCVGFEKDVQALKSVGFLQLTSNITYMFFSIMPEWNDLFAPSETICQSKKWYILLGSVPLNLNPFDVSEISHNYHSAEISVNHELLPCCPYAHFPEAFEEGRCALGLKQGRI